MMNEENGETEISIDVEEDSVVVIKPKVQRKSPRIQETDDKRDGHRSDAELLKPWIKRKSS